ncbi:GIN domain-containing protein [Sphingobacterium hungaricum]|uniref:Putative auto-transporter adhesin head GIN domain-containing protein n=1 Tax=Sphingobacterium hungaricum TaxID=2082723 RepID=A0A928UYH8_9SPHI|nr:DUF2807 domain-containing protein [Sphingobacterium hungaricum]MBE8715027.1 hypothetical protein [Sphingobacterium hungaricum]
MKTTLTLLVLFISTTLFAQQTRKVGHFSGIMVATSIQADYIHSDKNEVVVSADNADHLKYVKTEVVNGTLEIRIENNQGKSIRNVRAVVYGPNKLKNISVSSSARLTIAPLVESSNVSLSVNSSGTLTANVKASNLAVDVSSSANLKATVQVSDLACKVSSSADAVIRGSAQNTTIESSSSGTADLSGLKTKNATIYASSSSDASISVSDAITAKASSSARIVYTGNPKTKTVDTSSSGKVVAN